MRKCIALLILAVAPVLADEPVRKVLDVKYVDIGQVEKLALTFGLMSTRVGSSVAVSGTSGAVEAVELALKKLDVPPTDVELTGYMIAASKENTQGAELPAVLAPVVQQLRALLAYKEFRLIDTFRVRTSCGGFNASTRGVTPDALQYQFGVGNVQCSGSKDEPIHLQGLFLMASKPGNLVKLSTTLHIKEGQQIVVGKAGLPEGPLILVLTAHVIP